MSVTKEEVLAKAKELGVSLTAEQVEQHVKDGKLPEKTSEQRYLEIKAELEKMDKDKLIDKILDAQSEAKDRRLEAKELKEKLNTVTKQLDEFKTAAEKYPELEKQNSAANETIKSLKEAEKNRRTAILGKLPKEKAEKLTHFLNVDAITSDQFDSTLELMGTTKGSGVNTPSPAAEPAKITLSSEHEARREKLGMTPEKYHKLFIEKKKE